VSEKRKILEMLAAGQVNVTIWVSLFEPFTGELGLQVSREAHPHWTHGTYLYNIGPMEAANGELVAALIDGVDYEDTSTIRMALSDSPAPPVADGIGIEIFPHPATSSSVIRLTPNEAGQARLVVFDLLGRAVLDLTAEVAAGVAWDVPLTSVRRLARGAYVVRAVDHSGGVAQRSIVVVE
jgi:hypothetical protein